MIANRNTIHYLAQFITLGLFKNQLTVNPLVMGIRMLNTKMRAFIFVVHLIEELGEHKTLPTLTKELTEDN